MGEGSRIVRLREPALEVEGKVSVVEETGDEIGLDAEVSVLWQSLSRAGIEDAGRRAGSENAWIDAKMLDA
jgi:hypothetical protein